MNRAAIIKSLNKALTDRGWTRRELARRAGVDPGQLTRIMKGDFERLGGGLKRVCQAAGVKLDTFYDPRTNRDLMTALNEVWDGTHQDAKVIGDFIRALGRARTRPS